MFQTWPVTPHSYKNVPTPWQHLLFPHSLRFPFKEEKLSGLVIADPPDYPSKATAPPF